MRIASQAHQIGLELPLVGGDGWESPELLEDGGSSLEGSYFSSPFFVDDTRPAARAFVEKYTEIHGHAPDALAALGYDAATLLIDAIKRAESIDPKAIRRRDCRNHRTFRGVTGDITIGPNRNTLKPISYSPDTEGAPAWRRV